MIDEGNERITSDLPIVDADTAAGEIEDEATVLVSGFGSVGYPKAVPLALAEAERDLSLTIVSGGSTGVEIDGALVEAEAISRRYPYQARPPARAAVNDGRIAFSDRHISTLGDGVQFGGLVDPDVAVMEAIAVGEDWFVPSLSIGQTPAYVDSVDRLILEVNNTIPRSIEHLHDVYRPGLPPNRKAIPLSNPGERIGDSHIRFDPGDLEAVVKTNRRDKSYTFREPTATDRAIGANLVSFLTSEVERSPLFEDSLHIQFGVGSLGNALVSSLGDADLGERDIVYFGEVIQDGLLDMIDDEQLRAASATSLALSEDGQNRLFDDIERYAEDIILRPADLSNRPSLIDRFGVVAVNSAVEVDLYGHVNSTHVNGSRLLNGIGGSGDFIRNSPLSIIAMPATASNGNISRIVPMVPHVDHTEHDVDVIITELGVADLRGLSARERAQRIVEDCAHESFRPALETYLDRAQRGSGNVPHDLSSVFDWV